MDSRALAHRLEGDAYTPCRKYRAMLSDAPLQERQSTLDWCEYFAEQGLGKLGLPPNKGGDPFLFQCLGYELGLFDFNLMMRFGLQFGFVLRAVARLGSSSQQHWLDKISGMKVAACLAVTEVAHGSNVRGLSTIATFLPKENCFELHTPDDSAVKDYVTAAETADVGLIFAQLQSKGKALGIHAFLVPLRDEKKNLLPGVSVESCGRMGGLNGLTYSRLRFDQFRFASDGHLSKHGALDSQGDYHSKLKSESHRFQALVGTLVLGRALVAGGAAAGAKSCLTIALRYTSKRRQFGPSSGGLEQTLLSYQAVQHRLMPALATLLAIDAGRGRLRQTQHEYFEDSVEDRELETFTGALKAYTSEFAIQTAQLCRQTCGGVGCMEVNRLTELRNDIDLFTTMEGDNTILNLMVARNLITDFQRGLKGKRLLKAFAWATKTVNLAAQTAPLKSRDASIENITSLDFLSQATKFKRDSLRFSLGRRVRARLAEGFSLFDSVNACQAHCLFLARAYCEEKIFRCLRNVTESCPPGWDRRVLTHALILFALSRIENDNGWYLEQGFLSPRQSKAIRRQVLELSSTLAQESEMLLDSFELSEDILRSPLAVKGDD